MKAEKIFVALVLGLTVVACTPKAPAAVDENGNRIPTSKDFVPTKAQIDSVSYLLGVNFGSFFSQYDFGEVNYSQLVQGIKDFRNAKGNYYDDDYFDQFKINPNEMNDVLSNFLMNRQIYVSMKNGEEGKAYLEANAKKAGVQVTDSGLQYKIIEAGNDVRPASTDTVVVNYEGKLIDGTVFDKNLSDPISFALNRVIAGWTEGLQLIGEGGKIQLVIPADLAYGETGQGQIKPNSVLVFDVETLEVHREVPAAE